MAGSDTRIIVQNKQIEDKLKNFSMKEIEKQDVTGCVPSL